MTVAACIPNIPGKPGHGAGVAAYLKELLELSPAELRGVSVLLEKRLSTGTTSGSDQYRVPADQDLVVYQIHSTWRSSALATEVAVNAVFTAFSMDDMERVRLSNCVVALQNKDRNLAVFENRAMRMNAMRDTPLYYPAEAPLLVPATHTLQADFSLQDTTAAVVGNAADYSLVLTGILIPKRV